MKSNNFEGKVAFVTGAASGIGRATAIAFALEGASCTVYRYNTISKAYQVMQQ